MEPSRVGKALDWCAYQISPSWGARRMALREAYAQADLIRRVRRERRRRGKKSLSSPAWDGTSKDRMGGDSWDPSGKSIDAELYDNREDLQKACTALYRTNGHAHGAVEGRVSNEVGEGLRYKPTVRAVQGITERRAKLINETLEETSELVSKYGADRTGRLSYGALQRLAVRTFANYGELFIELGTRPTTRAPIPLTISIDDPLIYDTPPAQLTNPLVRLGVVYNENDEVIGYYRRKGHPEGLHYKGANDWEYVPAFWPETGRPRILHVFEPMFPNQSRGIPWLAAGIKRFQDTEDFWHSTVTAAEIEACFAAFIKTPQDRSPAEVAEAKASSTDSEGHRIEDIVPGMIEYLEPDEEVQFGNPSRPGGQFAPFIETSLRALASVGNIPYEVLAKNFFRTTFASGRLALIDGQLGFRLRRSVLVEQGFSKIGDEIAYQCIALGIIEPPTVDLQLYLDKPWLYERHEWRAQGLRHIDPEGETNANAAGLESDQTTIQDTLIERGQTLEDFLENRQRSKEAIVRQDVALRALQRDLEKQAGLETESDQKEPANAGSSRSANDE